jgi:hypothetical protein
MAPNTSRNPIPTTDKPPCPRRWIPVSLRIFVAMLVFTAIGTSQGCSPGPRKILREASSPDGKWKLSILMDSRGDRAVAVISDSSGYIYDERELPGLFDEPTDVESAYRDRDVYCTDEVAGISRSGLLADAPTAADRASSAYEVIRFRQFAINSDRSRSASTVN